MFWRKKKPQKTLKVTANPCNTYPLYVGQHLFIPDGIYEGKIIDARHSEGEGVGMRINCNGYSLAFWLAYHCGWISLNKRWSGILKRLGVDITASKKENEAALSRMLDRNCQFEIKDHLLAALDILPRNTELKLVTRP